MKTYTYRVWGMLYGDTGPARSCEAVCFRAAQDWIVGELAAKTEAAQRWHVLVRADEERAVRFDVTVQPEGEIRVSAPWIH